MSKQTFTTTDTKVKTVTAIALIGGGIAVAAAIGYAGFSYMKHNNIKFDTSSFSRPFISGKVPGYTPGYTPGYVPGYVMKK